MCRPPMSTRDSDVLGSQKSDNDPSHKGSGDTTPSVFGDLFAPEYKRPEPNIIYFTFLYRWGPRFGLFK